MHMIYPDPITCFDPTCMQDLVWGEVCIRWSSMLVVIVLWQTILMIYHGFYLYIAASLGIKWNHLLYLSRDIVVILLEGSIYVFQTSCQNCLMLYSDLFLNTRLHEVSPFLWSISKIDIIFMLGRDAHMNAYQIHVEVPWLFIIEKLSYAHHNLKRE